MTKFNVVQKRRRAAIANRKRQVHGHPFTGKLQQKSQPLSVSAKRKRKLLKKWRREQKMAVEKGLITMQDVEMAVADANNEDIKTPTTTVKFPMKTKSSKLRVKQLNKRGKKNKEKKNSPKPAVGDAMVE